MDIKTFKPIRQNAFRYWKQETKRIRMKRDSDKEKRRDINDDYRNAFECRWQFNHVSHLVNGGQEMHNSIFCSMGDWGMHISDLLIDDRFDKFKFLDECESSPLFRHYTRILLCVSEILTDLQNLLEILGVNNPRAKLSTTGTEVQTLITYINNTCKHKLGDGLKPNKLHIDNNHAPYEFADAGVKLGNPKVIPVPSLHSIIDTLIVAYKFVDKHLEDNYVKNYVDLLKKYETKMDSKVFPGPLVNDFH